MVQVDAHGSIDAPLDAPVVVKESETGVEGGQAHGNLGMLGQPV